MKTAALLLVMLLVTGCAAKCKDCLTLTPTQLFIASEKAWQNGYSSGFDDGEVAADKRRLKGI